MDLHALEAWTLGPGARARVRTGVSVAIPGGWEGQVRGRSGNSLRGLVVIHGTIDSDYRGDVGVVVQNASEAPLTVNVGDRIAQLVIAEVARVELVCVEELDETERGAGGFGSTGS
jgi:dUTP pyrophosphatase